MQQFLESNSFWTALVFFVAVCWVIKTVFDAVMAIQIHKRQGREPVSVLEKQVENLEIQYRELDHRIEEHRQETERRLSMHQRDLEDLHKGQSVVCRGVQALLDHALHNGNTDEMQAASDGIGKWLRTR